MLDVSGVPLLTITVVVLAVIMSMRQRGFRMVRERPEPEAQELATDLMHNHRRSEAKRVIHRNTGWSQRLSGNFVDAVAQDDARLPDVVDDYPDLPRDTRRWAMFLLVEGYRGDAMSFITDNTGWPQATVRRYVRRMESSSQ